MGEVVTEEQRQKVYEQTNARLERLKKEQGERVPPSRPAHNTIFVNDGSFLEMFKQMQQQYIDQPAPEPRPEEVLKTLPVFGRRRGGKILKTGIVEKKKPTQPHADAPKSAWDLYMMEVKKYKSAVCDGDPSRALVK